jgi:alkaline phosphatase
MCTTSDGISLSYSTYSITLDKIKSNKDIDGLESFKREVSGMADESELTSEIDEAIERFTAQQKKEEEQKKLEAQKQEEARKLEAQKQEEKKKAWLLENHPHYPKIQP